MPVEYVVDSEVDYDHRALEYPNVSAGYFNAFHWNKVNIADSSFTVCAQCSTFHLIRHSGSVLSFFLSFLFLSLWLTTLTSLLHHHAICIPFIHPSRIPLTESSSLHHWCYSASSSSLPANFTPLPTTHEHTDTDTYSQSPFFHQSNSSMPYCKHPQQEHFLLFPNPRSSSFLIILLHPSRDPNTWLIVELFTIDITSFPWATFVYFDDNLRMEPLPRIHISLRGAVFRQLFRQFSRNFPAPEHPQWKF